MSIPNTLTIYINTTIPGSQFIKYVPSMTIPKIDSKTVYFDPLVKLKQTSINLTPEQNRVAQFFEKNLFKSLIAQTKNFQEFRSLKEATENGIVDDNIQLTLKNIFKSNGLFYINNKPYTIFSVDWERGNWKVDTKISEVLNKGQYGFNSVNYRNEIKQQLVVAQQELNTLPEEAKQGPNYKNEHVTTKRVEPVVTPPVIPPVTPANDATLEPTNDATLEPSNDTALVPFNTNDVAVIENPSTELEPTNINTNVDNKELELVVPPKVEKVYPQIAPSPIIPPVESFINDVTPNMVAYTNKNISNMRKFFKESKYFYLIQSIYKSMTKNDQTIIKETQKIYTKQMLTTTFNKKYYDEIVQSLHIIPNNGKGNCFFIAVAEGINDYNLSILNQENKIKYLQYGETVETPFTQIVIRSIVANGILSNENILNSILETAKINAHIMNEEFDSVIQNVSEENYIDIINDIYGKNDNFFIKKPGTLFSNENLKNLFTVLNNYEERKQYLLDNTWADEKAIPILQVELGLTVLVIEKTTNGYRYPFPSILKHDIPIYNQWNKYMFIYLQDNHYEQINFDKYVKKEDKKEKQTLSIFDKNKHIIPPIYLIFLLYGRFYYPIDEENKKNVMILRAYLKQIDHNFIKITSSVNKDSIQFINNFVQYFPYKKSNLLKDKMNSEFKPSPEKTRKNKESPKKQTRKNVIEKEVNEDEDGINEVDKEVNEDEEKEVNEVDDKEELDNEVKEVEEVDKVNEDEKELDNEVKELDEEVEKEDKPNEEEEKVNEVDEDNEEYNGVKDYSDMPPLEDIPRNQKQDKEVDMEALDGGKSTFLRGGADEPLDVPVVNEEKEEEEEPIVPVAIPVEENFDPLTPVAMPILEVEQSGPTGATGSSNFSFSSLFPSSTGATGASNFSFSSFLPNLNRETGQTGQTGQINQNKSHFTSQFEKKSNISYYIIITLDLYPGTEISTSEKVGMACQSNHNKLQQAWAELLGKQYSLPPNYKRTNNSTKNKNNSKSSNKKTRRNG